MEVKKDKINGFIRFLKNTDLISSDIIYRLYYKMIFGSKLYYKNKISSFTSCVFCKKLSYNKITHKYQCFNNQHTPCSDLLPCIVPNHDIARARNFFYAEEEIPWLFKAPCSNFESLGSDEYFKNFLSLSLNNSIIRLEALEGIMFGNSCGDIPCYLCAGINKELYQKCIHLQKAKDCGRCNFIYNVMYGYYNKNSNVIKVS